jgi:hypothetical protein
LIFSLLIASNNTKEQSCLAIVGAARQVFENLGYIAARGHRKKNVAVTRGKSQQQAKVESESSLEKRKVGKR